MDFVSILKFKLVVEDPLLGPVSIQRLLDLSFLEPGHVKAKKVEFEQKCNNASRPIKTLLHGKIYHIIVPVTSTSINSALPFYIGPFHGSW